MRGNGGLVRVHEWFNAERRTNATAVSKAGAARYPDGSTTTGSRLPVHVAGRRGRSDAVGKQSCYGVESEWRVRARRDRSSVGERQGVVLARRATSV